ncbi:hypothetical protein ACFWQL_23975 [Amycolatopsis thermoflava]|uniref:hypothetical protein n=1 Tax=Amycolatopsis thermoflava TaxID=84480 RepID=UPI0036570D66
MAAAPTTVTPFTAATADGRERPAQRAGDRAGFAELIMTRGDHGPGGLRLAEVLAAAGLDVPAQVRFYLVVVPGRAHREVHGDLTTPERDAGIFEAARASSAAPTLKALVPHLRAATADEVFDAELDMLAGAIHAARRQ